MAAGSAAIDSDVAIDVVLSTGRWTSWTVLNKFYNQSFCSSGRLHFDGLARLSSLSVVCRFRSLSQVECEETGAEGDRL